MAYIGNNIQTQGFTPAIDYFNGNGVTVTFTLSRPVASVAQMIVAIDNVIQNPSSAFNVSGNAITFTSAPLSGTNNIWVEYTSLITTYAAISQDPSVIGDITATGGFLSTGDFGNSFIDGAVIDYVTGAGRITVGELDNLIFYHGGTSGRSEMMKLSYAGASTLEGGLTTTGNVGIGTTTPATDWGGSSLLQVNTASTFSTLVLSSTRTPVNDGRIGSISWEIPTNTSTYRSRAVIEGLCSGSTTNKFGGTLVFATAADNTTYPTERMRIDSNGYVTTPFQPAFKAFPSAGISLGSGVTNVTFNSTSYNVGSCYNTSTGLFTAPVAGVYIFESVFYLGNLATAYWGIRYLVNGTASQDAFYPGFPDTTVLVPFSVKLSANDTVRIAGYFGGSATIGAGVTQSHFAGFLQG